MYYEQISVCKVHDHKKILKILHIEDNPEIVEPAKLVFAEHQCHCTLEGGNAITTRHSQRFARANFFGRSDKNDCANSDSVA